VSNDITCVDRSKSGVYLALDAPNPDVRGCSSSYSGSSLVVEVYRYGGDGSEFDPAHPSEEGTVLPGTTYLPRTLNGLDAFLVTFSGVPPSYTVVLPDDDLLIQIFQVGVEHEALAAQIIETIGAAPDTPATSVVSTSTTTSAGPVATTGPQGPDLDSSVGGDLDAFCAALEEYRQAGLSTGEQGFPSAAALPIFQRVLEAAPPEFRLPIATIVDWLEAGAPEPIPAEVASAGGQSTTDWAQNCSGSSAKTPEERAQAGR